MINKFEYFLTLSQIQHQCQLLVNERTFLNFFFIIFFIIILFLYSLCFSTLYVSLTNCVIVILYILLRGTQLRMADGLQHSVCLTF